MKRIDIICFSQAGALLAKQLRQAFEGAQVQIYATPELAQQHAFEAYESLHDLVGASFQHSRALVFICAAGIAVRSIAPFLKSKTQDPAVLVADDGANYVISLLSGHIGGANALAKKAAAAIGAQAVITTATDVAGKFSCDAWAAENGFAISSLPLAKRVSAAILNEDIPLCAEVPLPEHLPQGLCHKNNGEIGIYIGIENQEPFADTLRLIPRVVRVGIGCRKGTSAESIKRAIAHVLDDNGVDMRAVSEICSIDVKQHEAGLREAAADLQATLHFYSAEELLNVTGNFEESPFVREQVGVGNVCERAAVCAGGTLIIQKTAQQGITVAAAVKEWRVCF